MEIISNLTSSASLVVVVRTHKRLNIFPFLKFASILLNLNINPPRSVNPLQENTSSITMLGQVSQHPSLLDGNHHMSTFPLVTKYAWIGQGFHSKIPNHGHSICGVDWGAQHSCGEISHGNSTKRYIKSRQHMDTPHAFSNYLKTSLNHGLNLSEVDWGDLKRESTKHEPSLMEVDWERQLRVNHIDEYMLSEVDWGAHDSSFVFYLVHIDHDAEPKDFFTQGL